MSGKDRISSAQDMALKNLDDILECIRIRTLWKSWERLAAIR